MNKNKFLFWIVGTALVLGPVACKDQLDVGNPNAPTLAANVNTETGILQYAQGATYLNGFNFGNGWLGDSYFSLPWGFSELLADNVGATAANNQVSSIALPEYIILDNGIKITNSGTNVAIIRSYNSRASTGAGNNALIYQWQSNYALNFAANAILEKVDAIPFSGDAVTKANTLKAWAYWWKGYAYASIGSMYISGLIVDKTIATNGDYVGHDAIVTESSNNFNKAATILQGISNTGDYNTILGNLIPGFCQVGNGGVLTPQMWIRNINTMLARNILVNKLAPFVNGNPSAAISKSNSPVMTASDWNTVKTLTTNGVQKGDKIFTARSSVTNAIFTPNGGTVASLSSNLPTSSTFTVSERLLNSFKPADNRKTNNFTAGAGLKTDYTYTTRWRMNPDGNGIAGAWVYSTKTAGAYEVVIAGSYEENTLMLAEANIRTGGIDAGVALIDNVRSYMGAGLPATATGLSLAAALNELVSERRVALVFRGLSFYDNRRWGWSYSIANGGGTYGNYVINSAITYTNVTISYNFMDYWDVPADETVLNPPSATSSSITNTNF